MDYEDEGLGADALGEDERWRLLLVMLSIALGFVGAIYSLCLLLHSAAPPPSVPDGEKAEEEGDDTAVNHGFFSHNRGLQTMMGLTVLCLLYGVSTQLSIVAEIPSLRGGRNRAMATYHARLRPKTQPVGVGTD